jgi:hypothetical protein
MAENEDICDLTDRLLRAAAPGEWRRSDLTVRMTVDSDDVRLSVLMHDGAVAVQEPPLPREAFFRDFAAQCHRTWWNGSRNTASGISTSAGTSPTGCASRRLGTTAGNSTRSNPMWTCCRNGCARRRPSTIRGIDSE